LNSINPKKLLNSKWTSLNPINKEKHFIINEVEFDEDGNVISCLIEAVMTHRTFNIYWQDLKDDSLWGYGWA